jgi:hypothetical protein
MPLDINVFEKIDLVDVQNHGIPEMVMALGTTIEKRDP